MIFFRLSKHEKFTEFTHLDSLNLIRRGTKLYFLTFFRLSKYKKFTEFTRLDSLKSIKQGKIWTKWILSLLHFKKGRFGRKILEHGTSQKTLSQLAKPYHI